MMWVFDPAIAEHRKKYKILVKVWSSEDQSLGRRNAKIVTSESPAMFPLNELEEAVVEIEYTDNKSRPVMKTVPVKHLLPGDVKTKGEHIIISGERKGTIVKHIRTTDPNVRVKLPDKGTGITISKSIVCALEVV